MAFLDFLKKKPKQTRPEVVEEIKVAKISIQETAKELTITKTDLKILENAIRKTWEFGAQVRSGLNNIKSKGSYIVYMTARDGKRVAEKFAVARGDMLLINTEFAKIQNSLKNVSAYALYVEKILKDRKLWSDLTTEEKKTIKMCQKAENNIEVVIKGVAKTGLYMELIIAILQQNQDKEKNMILIKKKFGNNLIKTINATTTRTRNIHKIADVVLTEIGNLIELEKDEKAGFYKEEQTEEELLRELG